MQIRQKLTKGVYPLYLVLGVVILATTLGA